MSMIDPQFDSLVPGRHPDRRTFLATTLGAGFALAVQPVMAQTAIQTPAQGLLAGEVEIPVRDGRMKAYRAAPMRQGAPVVLVVSEIFGVHEHIRDVCRRLAHLGYVAIAPELFARQGDPRTLEAVPEILSKITNRTPDAEVMADLDATVAWAKTQQADTARLLITGFCWGGRIVWLYAAHQPRLKAAVAWYGRLTGAANAMTPQHPLDLVAQYKAPVLGLYGGADTGIPLEGVERMKAALAQGSAAARASEFVVYPDTPHAFHADYRPSYRQGPAEDGWQRLLAWLRRYGVA